MASKKNVFQTIQKKRKFADRPMSESEMTEGSTDTSKDSTGAKAVTERAVGVPESPQKTTDNNNGVVTLNINNTTDNNIGIVTLNMKTTTDSNIGVVTQDMKTTTDNNIGVVTQNMNKLTDNNIGVVTQNMNTTTDNNIGVVTCEQIPALPETPKIDNVDAKPVVYTIAPDKLRKIDNVDAKPGVYTIAPDKLRNIDNVDAEPVVYTIAPDKLRSLDADEDGSFHTMLAETISESEIIATTEVTNIVVKHDLSQPAVPKSSLKKKHRVFDVDDASGLIPSDIFYLNTDHVLQRCETFDQLSELLVNAALSSPATDSSDFLNKCKRILKVPVDTLDHYGSIGTFLATLYENKHLIDVVIDVRGTLFGAHRIALSCQSDFFADMFSKSTGRRIPFEFKIKGVSPEAFACFLEFCYTGKLTIMPSIAADILIVADVLRVNSFKRHLDAITDSLPLDQNVKMVAKSKVNAEGQLFKKLFAVIVRNLSAAADTSFFMYMDVDLLCQILSSDDLVVTSEYEVFTIAMRWLLADEQRIKHIPRVMGYIRFDQMCIPELFTCAETTAILRGYDKFRELVLIANWLLTARNVPKDDPFHFPVSRPRKYQNAALLKLQDSEAPSSSKGDPAPNGDVTVAMPPPVMTSTPRAKPASAEGAIIDAKKAAADILAIGGFESNEASLVPKYVERYDSADNQWVHFCRLPEPRRHHAAVVVRGFMYLIGGSNPCVKSELPLPTRTVFRMDLFTKQWREGVPMNEARYSHCACAINERIYVFGGKGEGDRVSSTVECFDVVTDGWFYVTPMAGPRYAATAASLGDRIYVAGGLGESREIPSALHVLDDVICLDTSAKSWSNAPNLRFARCYANLVAVDHTLFLCGGASRSFDYKNSVLISVGALDALDLTRNRWRHVADMLLARHDMGAAAVGDRIFMIGGVSSTADRVLTSVDCYDVMTGVSVTNIQELPYPARSVACVTVPSAGRRPAGNKQVNFQRPNV
ncbi:kelch-like protein 3 isoform X2 [Dreissena polymorpha]|uniref:kelch-like protein 3 isoform X2 n=1 Tax=Dreissena polymorpha TaxID=45954 RepID=UPI002264C482|nr:kelch-like protein 3 isoform X2 [Dreissena polymorpha]